MTDVEITPHNPAPFMLTIDLEPDWGVAGDHAIRQALPRFCALLRRLGMPATFFVTATLLDSCGELLRQELQDFETASHGLTHRPLAQLGRSELLKELVGSKHKLEEFFGRPVTGFRAPFLKIPLDWFSFLAEAGYGYDSSLGSVAPSLRNRSQADWRLELHGGIVEIPVTTLATGLIPFSLTYLRLLAPLGERLIEPEATLLYLHLHELVDPTGTVLLPPLRRLLLRRNAGETAWTILERVLPAFVARSRSCGEVAAAYMHKETALDPTE